MTTNTLPSQSTVPSPDLTTEETHFQSGQVITIAGGHFVHDTFTGFLAPLLPLIQDKLGIGYADAGGLVVFTQIPSLLMPFIGYLADKVSVRYFVILAPAVTATLMSFIGFAPHYLILTLLLLAVGLSVAAFHAPAPAMVARTSGRRMGTGMSIFMASGELGRTLGPVVVVAAVTWWGLDGIWRLAVAGWLMSAVLYWRLHTVTARPPAQGEATLAQMWPQVRRVFPVLIWIKLTTGFMAVAMTTYLPIFMRDALHTNLWLAAASLSILEGAGVVGALATGTLSDKWGRTRILFVLFVLAPLFLAVFLYGPLWMTVPILLALGLTAISPTPVLLAIVQDEFPKNRAVSNGIFMFLNFLTRALALWAVGVMADRFGLVPAFVWSGIIALAGIPAVLWLPGRRREMSRDGAR